jgi:hypothetical protein
MQLVVVSIFLLLNLAHNSYAAVGKVVEQTGPTEIIRNKKSISSSVNTGVEMNDTIVTAKSRAALTFDDNTSVKVTEHSKLVIDDFVYDSKKGTGKLAMKVVLGTARYASGQIAKTNPQAVDIKTPTATVAVRGTDFSMTVDELGRSIVMLLPSCDKKACVTGAIEVSTDAGSVYMDTAYQTTIVASRDQAPSKPVIVQIDQMNINNLLIISPPKPVEDEKHTSDTKTALDINFLDKDFLKYNALDKDELKFDLLGINELDSDLLPNILDESTRALSASQEVLAEQTTMLPGYSEASGLKYGVTDDGKLVLTKVGSHTAQITVEKEASLVININQDGVPLYQRVNSGGTTNITIVQK